MPFSCKRRGICPSCTARRAEDTAAHLVDHVLPRVPYRQWVFTFPIPIRLALSHRPHLVTAVLQACLRALFSWQRRRLRRRHIVQPHCGAITLTSVRLRRLPFECPMRLVPPSTELITRLLATPEAELRSSERHVRTLVLLDQAVQGFESFEDFFRGGGSARAALDALTSIGATPVTISALRSAFMRMGAFDSTRLETVLNDTTALTRMRESCVTYHGVVEDISGALDRHIRAHGLG